MEGFFFFFPIAKPDTVTGAAATDRSCKASQRMARQRTRAGCSLLFCFVIYLSHHQTNVFKTNYERLPLPPTVQKETCGANWEIVRR